MMHTRKAISTANEILTKYTSSVFKYCKQPSQGKKKCKYTEEAPQASDVCGTEIKPAVNLEQHLQQQGSRHDGAAGEGSQGARAQEMGALLQNRGRGRERLMRRHSSNASPPPPSPPQSHNQAAGAQNWHKAYLHHKSLLSFSNLYSAPDPPLSQVEILESQLYGNFECRLSGEMTFDACSNFRRSAI